MIAHNLLSASSLSSLSAALREAAPAIANHLWQSTAFAAAAGLLTLTLRNNAARTRHWIWLAASLKFLLPFALLSGLAAHFGRPIPASQAPAVYYAVEDFSEPFAVPPVVAAAAPVAVRETIDLRDWAAIAVAAIWLAGFLTASIVWAARWRRIARAVRAAEILQGGREVEMLRELEQAGGLRSPMRMVLAESAMEPGVFGMMRPALIWPEGISERLDAAHLEAVLAHEVCHVRRRDNLLAALHMLVQAVFWFHPLVWWMGARLVAERERACDEAVLELCGRPHIYAESILKVCEFCVESPLACVAGITGADLKRRIVEIMQARTLLRLTWAKRALIAAAMVCAVAVPFAMAQANSVRAAQRVMLAAIDIAPKPLQTAAHAMIAVVGTPGTGEIVEAQAPAGAQRIPEVDETAGRAFEVTTVKPADPNARFSNLNLGNDDIKSTNLPVLFLLQFAYGLNGGSKDQIIGAPAWVSTARFDIEAKMDEPTAAAISKMTADRRVATLRGMMRTLLADRFHLVVHRETQTLPVFALMVAKGGPKLVSSAVSPIPKGEWTGLHNPGSGQMEGRDVTTGELASALSSKPEIDGRLVVDETGLSGKYNFTLAWAAENARSAESGNAAGPSLFTALKEQLGLQLAGKKVPVDCIAIDHIEQPSVDGAEVRTAASPLPVAMVQGPSMTTTLPTMQAASSGPRFVVSTVKPSSEATSGSSGIYTGHGRLDGKNVTLKRCIIGAYGIGPHQVVGGPDWIDTLRWDIEAKADQDINDDATLNAMQANLCADRFKLVMHKEIRTLPAYVLEIDKGGPKMEKAKGGDSDTEMSTGNGGRANLKIRNTDMDLFAAVLARKMDLPVVNQTGLKGIYNFDLHWTPDGTNAANGPDALSIFTAIQELGLKLRPAKAPVEVLVVDHAEMPSAN